MIARRLLRVAAVSMLIGGIIFGAAATQTPGGAEQTWLDIRSTARVALGLPKNWYDVRRVARAAGPAVPCPDPAQTIAIVTGGQSNAANSNSRLTATAPADQVYMFDAGRCFTAADPIAGAAGKDGSLWPDLGQRLHAATGRPVLFINGGIGSTQVGDWLDLRSGYWSNLATRITAARALGFEPQWIIWHQGEADAATSISMARFQEQLAALTARLLAAAPRARLYLFEASRCIRHRNIAGVPAIRAAQRHVSAANPRITPGMNTDVLDNRYRSDGCHLNPAGREVVNIELARTLLGVGI